MKPNNKHHVFSGPEEFHVAMVRRNAAIESQPDNRESPASADGR